MSASVTASSRFVVATNVSLSFTPGRYAGFSWRSLIAVATSTLRIHWRTSTPLSARILATTVPKLPPPMTAARLIVTITPKQVRNFKSIYRPASSVSTSSRNVSSFLRFKLISTLCASMTCSRAHSSSTDSAAHFSKHASSGMALSTI